MKDQTETPLTERKVVRRGLIAGLAGLGAAALLKVTGAEKAEANGETMIVGVSNPPVNGGATATTNLTATTATPVFTTLQLTANSTGIAATANAGGSVALYGQASPGVGVQGWATGAFGFPQTAGVMGMDSGGLAPNPNFAWKRGVYGSALNVGVQGRTQDGRGVSGEATGVGTGVAGYSNAGANSAVEGNGSGIGVYGQTASGVGVQGKSGSGPGVQGNSVSSLGVRGLSTNFVGVVGISDTSHGLYGSTSNAGAAGLVGENLSGGVAGFFYGSVQIYGGLQVFGGPKNAVLKMQDGTFASVYCQESPEPYFEDFGKAQLAGGVASVALEREFASLVADGEYLVFLTPEGDTRGLFVSRKGPGGFEVREVQGGTGNVPFTYRIVTKRKDIEGKRFARVNTDAAQNVAGARAVLAAMGTAGPSSGPASPLPTQQAAPPVITNVPPAVPGGPSSTIAPPGAGPSANPNAGR